MSGGGDRLNPLTFISLFSGIGGLDLGLERAGFKLIAHSEIEPYCCRVHEKHWPGVPNLGDVRTIDWSKVERPDLICGGYPCQPFSLAGARRGETDERHLWPAMRDAISVLRPRFALLENVPGHLSLGFGRVLGDLAEVGYDAEWDCIPAAAVGAPHRRDRLFVVAYPDGRGFTWRSQQNRKTAEARQQASRWRHPDGLHTDVADTHGTPWYGSRPTSETVFRSAQIERPGRRDCSLGDHWAVEPDVGRVAHGIPCRVDRLRALGNAVVPQVAEWIGAQLLASLENAA